METDPSSNFFKYPKTQGHFRNFSRNRSKYRYMGASSRDKFVKSESTSSLASITGSTQNLLDSAQMMSMQEDVRSHKISSEVMKNRLYASVIVSPRKRRFSMRAGASGGMGGQDMQAYVRMVQSMPVTPAHSQNVTPSHSPTQSRRFTFGMFSRGTTPNCLTPEELDEDEDEEVMMETEDDKFKGLNSILKPQPRFISASRDHVASEEQAMDCEMQAVGGLEQPMGQMPPPEKVGFQLLSVPSKAKRSS